MILKEAIREKIGAHDIRRICALCSGEANNQVKAELFALIHSPDDRIGYNALWIFTHFAPTDIAWLQQKHNKLIDLVLTVGHEGKRRLLLTLLDRLIADKKEFRGDYLDFCLSRINSTEPCSIRALCLKQAFSQCRFYPELIEELKNEIELMEYGELSQGLRAVIRNIRKKIDSI